MLTDNRHLLLHQRHIWPPTDRPVSPRRTSSNSKKDRRLPWVPMMPGSQSSWETLHPILRSTRPPPNPAVITTPTLIAQVLAVELPHAWWFPSFPPFPSLHHHRRRPPPHHRLHCTNVTTWPTCTWPTRRIRSTCISVSEVSERPSFSPRAPTSVISPFEPDRHRPCRRRTEASGYSTGTGCSTHWG